MRCPVPSAVAEIGTNAAAGAAELAWTAASTSGTSAGNTSSAAATAVVSPAKSC